MTPQKTKYFSFCVTLAFVLLMTSCAKHEVDKIDALLDYYSTNYPKLEDGSAPTTSDNSGKPTRKSQKKSSQQDPAAEAEETPLITPVIDINVNAPDAIVKRNGKNLSVREANLGLINQDTFLTSDKGGAVLTFAGEERFVASIATTFTFTEQVTDTTDDSNSYQLNLENGSIYLRPRAPESARIIVQAGDIAIEPANSSCIIRNEGDGIIVGALDGPVTIISTDTNRRLILTPGKQILVKGEINSADRRYLMATLLSGFEREINSDYRKPYSTKSVYRGALENISIQNASKGSIRSENTSGDNRELKDYYVTFKPVAIERDPYYQNVFSYGWILDREMSVSVQVNRGTGSVLSGITVTAQDLTVFRVGGTLRQFFYETFNGFASVYYSNLGGTLTFTDSGSSNTATLRSHALSVHLGVGNQIVTDGGVMIGIDWIVLPVPLIHSYSLSFAQNATGTAAQALSTEFSSTRPVLQETNNTVVALIYLGYAF